MKRGMHKAVHPECPESSWSACDASFTGAFAAWDAMQKVILAYNIVMREGWMAFRKQKGVFAQLVLMIAGEQDDILNGDRNPSMTKEVVAIRAAIGRFKEGNIGPYNLYAPRGG